MPTRKRQSPPMTLVTFSDAPTKQSRTASDSAPAKDLPDFLITTAPLNKREAERITAQIKSKPSDLWRLIARAHDGRAYEALGYDTWKDYTTRVLGISESRSFQLLDQARVMRELAEVGADPNEVQAPTRIVQAVKQDLPRLRELAAEALARGEDLSAVMRAYAEELEAARARPRAPRKSAAKTVACPCCGGTGLLTASEANTARRRLGLPAN